MSIYSNGRSYVMHQNYGNESYSGRIFRNQDHIRNMADAVLSDLRNFGFSWFIDRYVLDPKFSSSLQNQQILGEAYYLASSDRRTSSEEKMLLYLKVDYPRQFINADGHSSEGNSCAKAVNIQCGDRKMQEEQKTSLEKELCILKEEINKAKHAAAEMKAQTEAEADSIRAAAAEDADRMRAEAEKELAQAAHTREMLSRTVLEETVEKAEDESSEERLTKSEVARQIQMLENAAWERLEAIRDEVKSLTMNFRLGLYRDESRKLCKAFVKLNRFATEYLDNQKDKITAGIEDTVTRDTVENGLLDIQRYAINLVKDFENGMKYLEFAVIRPKTGDEYNPGEHLLAVGNDDGELEGTVEDCLSPGVKTASEVVEAAGVTVKPC